jgi:predicted dehydrogenase
MDSLRIGTLGAARITPSALIKPARAVNEAVVAAVAARDPERAKAFAAKHEIPTVHATYDDLIADPSLDAIYNPLPNGLHAEWTLKSLAAGKHVLCEKPFTSNAAEAEEVAAAAGRSGKVVMEAFHYRYHPLAARMRAVIESGTLGTVRHIETWNCFPLPMLKDIRWQLDLAGGSTMDAGCYAVHCLRMLGNGEPAVVSARAKVLRPEVDRWMTASFTFPDGASGRITTSMLSARVVGIGARVLGDEGTMKVFNFVAPQYYNRLSVRARGSRIRERVRGEPTYNYQLRAFCAAVQKGEPTLTPPEDSIRTMRVIDDIYRAAGLRVRGAQ